MSELAWEHATAGGGLKSGNLTLAFNRYATLSCPVLEAVQAVLLIFPVACEVPGSAGG